MGFGISLPLQLGIINNVLQIQKKGLYPSIYVNSENKPFTIRNGYTNIDIKYNQRMFFNCIDTQGNIISPSVLNTQFFKGCFCPQGYKIQMLHIGYSNTSDLEIKKPTNIDIEYTNKQILKICQPFILGIVVQNISDQEQYIYIQMDIIEGNLLNSIQNTDNIGLIQQNHIFSNVLWNDINQLNSQYRQGNLLDSMFHTLIPIQSNKQLIRENNQQLDLKQFLWQNNTNSSIIGIVYKNQNDLSPLLIYGYDYDLLLFTNKISPISTDVFYYSQEVCKILGVQTKFEEYIINIMELAFTSPRLIPEISESKYIQAQIQLLQILQGTIPIFGKLLNGKLDSIATELCQTQQYKDSPACSCINLELGSSCDNYPKNTTCRQLGYKTQKQITQQCIPSVTSINYYDQSSTISLTSGGSITADAIGIQQQTAIKK